MRTNSGWIIHNLDEIAEKVSQASDTTSIWYENGFLFTEEQSTDSSRWIADFSNSDTAEFISEIVDDILNFIWKNDRLEKYPILGNP